MATTTLTDRLLDRTPTVSGRVELWDTIVPGFGVRITAHQKSFFLSFRSPQAKAADGRPIRRRVSMGEYPKDRLATARSKAAEIRDQLEQGIDPYHVEVPEPSKVVTFGEIAIDYLERHAKKKKKSWRNDECHIRASLLPAWGSRLASSVTVKDVRRLLEEISERTPVHANRVHGTLRGIFKWGVRQWDLDHNPARDVERLHRELPRERVLTADEIRALWRTWSRSSDPVIVLLKLRLLTAQRGLQLCRLHASELETRGEDLWWNVPSSSTKTRRPYRVLLGPLARRILETVKPDGRGSWFSWNPKCEFEEGRKVWRPTTEISMASGVTSWQPRDLRRTAATLMAERGVSRFIIKRVLGHTDREITAVYDLYSYDREVKEAVLTLEGAVRAIVDEGTA